MTGGQGVAGSNPVVPTEAAGSEEPSPPPDLIWTVPNALSFARLLGVPVFLWLVLGPHADGAAILLLMASGFTDYLDGKLARAWGQTSRIGALLDPLADRLYIAATIVAFTLRGVIPLWLAIALVLRDVVLACTLPVLHRLGYGPLPVHFLGKAATFNLLYAFPMLLAAHGHGLLADVFAPLAVAFTGWGSVLYWWAGWLYLAQVRLLARAAKVTGPPGAAT